MAGDCIAAERRAEVSQEMFDRFQQADRDLPERVKSALTNALISHVRAPQRRGAALGLDGQAPQVPTPMVLYPLIATASY